MTHTPLDIERPQEEPKSYAEAYLRAERDRLREVNRELVEALEAAIAKAKKTP